MSTPYRAVLLLGLPGTGKGTQGRILGAVPGFHHSASGDIFRSLDRESELGRRVHERMSRGEMLSDEQAVELWREHLRRQAEAGEYDPERQTLLLDGIPRTAGQAAMLEADVDVVRVLHLVADEPELVDRLLKRALDQGRADDASEDVIRHRIATHRDQIAAVLRHYASERVVEIDARPPILEVLAQVVQAMIALQREGG